MSDSSEAPVRFLVAEHTGSGPGRSVHLVSCAKPDEHLQIECPWDVDQTWGKKIEFEEAEQPDGRMLEVPTWIEPDSEQDERAVHDHSALTRAKLQVDSQPLDLSHLGITVEPITAPADPAPDDQPAVQGDSA